MSASLFQEGELGPHPPTSIRDAFDAWNAAAKAHGWPVAQILSDGRVTGLKRALRLCAGLAGWKAALEKAGQSAFLTGKTGRTQAHANWRPDIAFFTSERNLLKVIEGGFSDVPAAARESWREKQAREAREAVERALSK
jgi:hypothetical protein